jgi:hypothetical protein
MRLKALKGIIHNMAMRKKDPMVVWYVEEFTQLPV